MDVLLSFIGSKDPYWTDSKGQKHIGPLLSLLQERSFDVLHLFFNIGHTWNQRAGDVLKSCQVAGRREKVVYSALDILDVTDYVELFRVMNDECQKIRESYKEAPTNFWIATASGTPAMQTIWVLLAQSRLFPATLLITTPPQHARPGASLVREVNLNLDEFPHIQSPDAAKRQLSILRAQIETLKTQNAVLQANSGSLMDIPLDGLDLRATLRQSEVAYYRLALERSNGNAASAARLLNIAPHAFRKRAVDLGILERKQAKNVT